MIVPAMSLAFLATMIHSNDVKINKTITVQEPTNPDSSPITAKIKSVCGSEMKLPFFTDDISLFLYPFPVSCPEPMAITELIC